MSNELAKVEERNDWAIMREQAAVALKSGFLPVTIKTPEQALTIMLTGRELGVPPMIALRGINVIQQTPAIKPELMLALCVQRIQGFKYGFGKCDNTTATFWAQRPEMPEAYTSVFTMEDAAAAGLAQKDNWKKWPGNMLRWRAVGNALHVVAPDVLVGVYTPDELGVVTDEDGTLTVAQVDTQTGEIIEAEVVTLICADCGEEIVGRENKNGRVYTAQQIADFGLNDPKIARALCTPCGFADKARRKKAEAEAAAEADDAAKYKEADETDEQHDIPGELPND
jgi:predicted RNA-binding Zn-ribbon protein involved in translation (DUF1610 family)